MFQTASYQSGRLKTLVPVIISALPMLSLQLQNQKMMLHTLHVLIILVSFTGNQDDVVCGGTFDCVTDSGGAVGFDAFGRGNGGQDVVDDILRIFQTWVSLVTTTLSAPCTAAAPISGRLPRSRLPPQPNTHHKAAPCGLISCKVESAFSNASGVWA